MIVLKSVLHNIGVLVVSFAWALIGVWLDRLLGFAEFYSAAAILIGCVSLALGFFIRARATFCFYKEKMDVIRLAPQRTLITQGPYRHSRNPLYLGGNIFMFLGASLILGSPMAIIITAAHLPLMDLFVRREERQLAKRFGPQWEEYKKRVPRWI